MKFVKATPSIARLKMGIYGFAGSGKTYTATQIAIGLGKRIKTKKPIVFFDTETGSDFMIPLVEKAGMEIFTPEKKTRALKDVTVFLKEAAAISEIVIIDSVSHIWTDLQESYLAGKKRSALYLQDWAVLKKEWRVFTDLFLTIDAHVILCGRAAYEYDYSTNEETGKKDLVKTGTKMRAEGEFGYEPSLLLEMERVKNDKKGGWQHVATVLKDRTDLINGKQFINPTFKDIEAHLNALNIGGVHAPLDPSVNSNEMFTSDGESYASVMKKKEFLLEELKSFLDLKYPPQGESKKARIWLLNHVFGGYSLTNLETKSVDELTEGIARIVAYTPDQVQALMVEDVPR